MARALALAATLAVSSAAFAQTIIDGIEVSPDDLPEIRAQCDALAVRERESLSSDEGSDLLEPSSDPASVWAAGANGMDSALTRFDLDRLTLAKCKAAGLVR
jgi:hypothetical protein